MKHATDIVWDTITESAKSRFDYEEYKAGFEVGGDHIADNILFKIIVGYIEDKTNEEIAADITTEVTLIGLGFEDGYLETFLKDKRTELRNEIHATEIAIALFNMGMKSPGVLIQVKKLLSSA